MIRTLILAALVAVTQANSQSSLFMPAPGSPVVIGKGPGQVLLADINNDGRPDLVRDGKGQDRRRGGAVAERNGADAA